MSVEGRLSVAARAIEPILNRVVLVGAPVVELLMNDSAVRTPRLTFGSDSTLQLLSTSMVDRLAADLQKAGLQRVGRAERGDRWRVSADVEIDLIQVRADDSDPTQVRFEYATLLTLPHALDGGTVVRIAGAPAMLAIELAAFETGGGSVLESEELERVVQLIAARKEIETECAAAPGELRSQIASALRPLADGDALPFLIRRALPDAELLPALGVRVRERVIRMARLAP